MCVLIVVISFIRVMFWGFGDMDEIWNYDMIKGIVLGYVPYRDFNWVQTPLYGFVSTIALFMSKTLLSYRIWCSIVLSVLMLLTFRVTCRKTDIYYAFPVIMACLVFTYTINYNTLFLILTTAVFILLGADNTKVRNVALGVLAACAALSRQSSGSLVLIVVLVVLAGKLGGEEDRRKRLQDSLLYLVGVSLPCFVLLIYLLSTHSFFDFWNNCLFNLYAFGSENSRFSISDTLLHFLVIFAGMICEFLTMKENKRYSIIHFLLGLAVLSTIIPIVDGGHTSYAAVWFTVPIVTALRDRLGKYLKKWVSVVFSLSFGVLAVSLAVFSVWGCARVDDCPELYGILVDRDMVSDFRYIAGRNEDYRQNGYSVNILSSETALISITGNTYDPQYKGSVYDHVESICADPNAVILMPEDYYSEIYEYVTDNCIPLESFGRFTWYVPKEVVQDG